MIGNTNRCMYVIADSVSCTFGVKIQNWEKNGRPMTLRSFTDLHEIRFFMIISKHDTLERGGHLWLNKSL